MGTSQGFILLKNNGFTPETLRERMTRRPAPSEEEAWLLRVTGAPHRSPEVVAFREDAAWLPYFEGWRCEGCFCSGRELRELSERFAVPALAFFHCDSDVLFLSYCDAAAQIVYDYAKPNCPDLSEYDLSGCQQETPMFLLSLNGENGAPNLEEARRLKEIWNEEGLIFSDDRMEHLLGLLDMQVMYVEEDIPNGFTRVSL